MDRTTQTPETPPPGDPHPQPRPRPHPRPDAAPQGGTALIVAQAFVQTVRHFFPDLNDWLEELPDSRDPEAIVYETRFLAWWGLWLYLGQLRSRRQLDFQLDAWGTRVLDNLNRLAQTQHETRPVHDTLDHFVGHLASHGLPQLRTQMSRRLIRMRVFDPARLLGHLVLLIDGTGLLCWHRRHCDHCLVQRHQHTTLYLHNVLEAKLLGPAGLVVSVGSEFIDNADAADSPGHNADDVKQDCELKALERLVPQIKTDFPQTRFVLAGDNLFACGRTLQLCQDCDWLYVLTFKPGRMPAVWAEFQQLLPLCPRQRLVRQRADGTRQEYAWVRDLSYTDDQGRTWRFHAIQCLETSALGVTTRFAWITPLPVSATNVEEIAQKGGRSRWKIENEGFNRQKNSGLNLAHVYSTDPEKWQAYYYLLQIAFILTQLLERGSLLRQLVADLGQKVRTVFGSLSNIAQQLRESLKYCLWPESCFDAAEAARRRIGLDSS
jgi:hypothetical protein